MSVAASSLVQQETSKVRRFLLYSMFIVLMIDNMPNMGIGIGLGLSAKNLYLYSLVLLVGIRAVTNPAGLRFVDLDFHVPYWLMMLYAALTWGMLSISDPTYSTFRGAITVKNQLIDLYLFMFAFRYGIESKTDYLSLLRAIIITLFVSTFVTLIDYLNIPDLGLIGLHKGRTEGLIGEANQYGALLAFLIPVTIACMPAEQSRAGRWFWHAGVLTSAILLIATGSRGALLSLIAGSFLGVIYLRNYLDLRQVLRFTMISVLIAILLFIAFAILNFEFLVQQFQKTTSESLGRASSGRVDIWRAAILVMLEWPMSFIVGYGWNTFESSGMWKSMHNEYLDRWYEMGIIGLALYIAVLRVTVARVRRALADMPDEICRIMIGYTFGMMMIFVNIFFVAIPDPWTVIWMVTGLVMGLQATSSVSTRQPLRQ